MPGGFVVNLANFFTRVLIVIPRSLDIQVWFQLTCRRYGGSVGDVHTLAMGMRAGECMRLLRTLDGDSIQRSDKS